MFFVNLMKLDADFNEVWWQGWFTTAHIKRELKGWEKDYQTVYIKKATVGVLDVAGVEAADNG